MATVIASNLVIFNDGSGHGNQSHLVYASNQGRWWLFSLNTKTATVVNSYVSSSNDLTTATWSAGTSSPAFPSSRAMSANDKRNLGVCSLTNSTTDVAHLSVGIGPTGSTNTWQEHIRCTFTSTASITWDAAWVETTGTGGVSSSIESIKGNSLGVSTTSKFLHDSGISLDVNMDAQVRKSTNADSTATWTSGFAADVTIDSSIANEVHSYAFAPVASDVMLVVYDNGSAAAPNNNGVAWIKSGATGTWSSGSSQTSVGFASSTQDLNDWCLVSVDTTHIYAFRKSTTTAVLCRMFNGTSWSAPTSQPPSFSTNAFKAGAGYFAATDGTDLYLFAFDNTGNNAIYYVKGSTANGTISFGSWTQLETAGSTARNYISGYPKISNNQIGVIYTAVNGSNFDIVVSALSLGGSNITGDGKVVGFGVATGDPNTLAATNGSIIGLGVTAGVGASLSAAGGSVVGYGVADGTPSSLWAATGSVVGLGTLTGNPSSLATGAGQVVGLGAAAGTPNSLAAASGAVIGAGVAFGDPASLWATQGVIAGLGIVEGDIPSSNFETGDGKVVGFGTVTGDQHSLWAADGSSTGIGLVAGDSKSLWAESGLSQGVGIATGDGTYTANWSGRITGNGTATGNPASLFAEQGTVIGSSIAVGTPASLAAINGSVIGVSVCVAVGASISAASGQSTGMAVVYGTNSSDTTSFRPHQLTNIGAG